MCVLQKSRDEELETLPSKLLSGDSDAQKSEAAIATGDAHQHKVRLACARGLMVRSAELCWGQVGAEETTKRDLSGQLAQAEAEVCKLEALLAASRGGSEAEVAKLSSELDGASPHGIICF